VINRDPHIPYRGDRSGVRRFFERIFENVDNPLGWSLKLFTFRGIVTRVHLFTVLYIAGTMITPLANDAWGWFYAASMMIALFVLVTLHEFGHCFACRAVGGIADRVVLLPFGGLALCQPPHDWRSSMATTVGGPAVNVALLPVTAAALAIAGIPGTILFNPLNPTDVVNTISAGSNAEYFFRLGLWSFHFINIVLLGFNVLLPFFPLDGGRILQAAIWSRRSYRESMEVSILVGFLGAGALALFALFSESMLLLLIAIFGAITCFTERQRLRADADLAELNLVPGSTGLGAAPPLSHPVDRGPSKRELKRRERQRRDDEKLDGILEKISREGMQSITRAERRFLDAHSKKHKRLR